MNSTGTLFRISIFGESHGPVIGISLDGNQCLSLIQAIEVASLCNATSIVTSSSLNSNFLKTETFNLSII